LGGVFARFARRASGDASGVAAGTLAAAAHIATNCW
jgi:hypothetical protein